MKKMTIVAALAVSSFVSAWGFTFDDVSYWVGSGTNRVGLVIDWGGTAKAWGYKWNGEAPSVGEIVREVVKKDSRLTMEGSDSQYGLFMERFSYDANDNGMLDEGEPDQLKYEVYNPDSPYAAWGAEYAYDYYSWNLLQGPTADSYSTNAPVWADVGADSLFVESGTWYMTAFGLYGGVTLTEPTAAEKPFGFSDIRLWLGHGTNRVGLVVDWGGTAKAWGYKWNGEAPSVGEIIREVVKKDSRLTMEGSDSQYGLFMERFSYDANDNGMLDEGEPDQLKYEVYNPDSPYAAWGAEYAYDYYSWNLLQGPTADFYSTNAPVWADVGADSLFVKSGTWYMTAFGLYGGVTPTKPMAAVATASAMQFAEVDGAMYADMNAAMDAAKGGKSIVLNSSFVKSVASDGHVVTLGTGEDTSTYEFPAYYDVVVVTNNGVVSMTASLNEEKVRPTLAREDETGRKTFSLVNGKALIVPGNVVDGLYYGIASASSLVSGFSDPVTWVRAENGTVTLEAPAEGPSGFYRVCVSDEDESMIQ